MVIRLIANGGCRRDDATGFLSKLGAWAYLLESGGNTSHSYGTALNTTDHTMALTAVIEGLKAIPTASHIQIMLNSEYVMNGATIWMYTWKRNNWRTSKHEAVPNKELWVTLEELISSHLRITWRLERNMHGNHRGYFVDRLCQLALQEVISGMH